MKYYLIGIKGTGMSTLAQILHDLGNEVSGYDDAKEFKFTQKGLDERGIKIHYEPVDIEEDTIVSRTVAISEDHPEIKRVKKLGFNIKRYDEIIGELSKQFNTIGISGTHGKTTTSSLIRHILNSKCATNYFVGAGDGYARRENDIFILESDEFNRHFTSYHPNYSVITNIEEEHMECYKDIEDIKNTFELFANNTKKLVVACGDEEVVRKINYHAPVLFYGFDKENDVVIKNLKLTENGSSFDLYIKEELYGNFDIPLFGEYMILNATAAILICKEQHLSKEEIEEALQTFQNAKRRFETTIVDDTVIIDDYAHHPTEIKVTLDAIKQKYPERRLVVVFKPNTYSRTKEFTDEFVEALSKADKVYMTEIDANRERQEDYPGVSSLMILDKIKDAELISEDTIQKLEKEKGSVVSFMSCAYVDKLIDGFKETL